FRRPRPVTREWSLRRAATIFVRIHGKTNWGSVSPPCAPPAGAAVRTGNPGRMPPPIRRDVSTSESDTVLELLAAVRAGDPGSLDRLFPLVYDELRRLAATVRQGRAGETLNATALVHEA